MKDFFSILSVLSGLIAALASAYSLYFLSKLSKRPFIKSLTIYGTMIYEKDCVKIKNPSIKFKNKGGETAIITDIAIYISNSNKYFLKNYTYNEIKSKILRPGAIFKLDLGVKSVDCKNSYVCLDQPINKKDWKNILDVGSLYKKRYRFMFSNGFIIKIKYIHIDDKEFKDEIQPYIIHTSHITNNMYPSISSVLRLFFHINKH